MSKPHYGKSALLTSALLWGIAFVAVQEAMNRGWTPFMLLGVRGLLASLALAGFAIKRRFWLKPALIKQSIIAGLILFLGFVFQTYGQLYSSVSNASFITVMYVVFIPVLMWRKRHLNRWTILGVVLAVAGTAVLTVRESLSFHAGDALLLACAVVFAYHIMAVEKLAPYDDSLSATFIQVLTLGVLGFLMAVLTGGKLPTDGWIYVAYAGIISSGLAFFLQTYGQKHVNSTVAGILLTMEALFGAMGAILILGEPLTFSTLIGGFLMMSAVFMVELGPKMGVKLRRGTPPCQN
jgi:drug/metabolite transporter (DMT)-like permease